MNDLLRHKTLIFPSNHCIIVVVVIVIFSLRCHYIGTILCDNKYPSYMLIGVGRDTWRSTHHTTVLDRIGRQLPIDFAMVVYGFMLVVSTMLSMGQSHYKLLLLVISKIANSDDCEKAHTLQTVG